MTLRQARRIADITQREMADAIGVSTARYSQIEANPERTTIQQAKTIVERIHASYPEISFDDIFFDSISNLTREALPTAEQARQKKIPPSKRAGKEMR